MDLCFYVCETFASDYEKAIQNEGFTDVVVKNFPCFCTRNGVDSKKIQEQIEKQAATDTIVICSKQCRLLKSEEINNFTYKTISSNYCYSHLANDKFIEALINDRGYIVTNGWLKNWSANLENEKFTQTLAQKFYSEFCSHIVLIDSDTDETALENLIAFSKYIDMPYKHIDFGLEFLEAFIKSTVYEWRLKRKKDSLTKTLSETRKQAADYTAILNLVEKITKSTKKRDVIATIIDIFQSIFGAQNIHYIDDSTNHDYLVTHYNEFIQAEDVTYIMSLEKNSLTLKIQHNNVFFGVIESSDFLFPKYLKNYTNFAISIAKVSALVFSNVTQYEALEKINSNITYTSYHDTLTGLYNRNYYIKHIDSNIVTEATILYMCDIDGLKKVNDTFGHPYGDELIRMAADVLKKSVRETDIVARTGGDEFVIIQTVDNLDVAKITKARIEDAIKQINLINKEKLPFVLSLSVGFASKDSKHTTWMNLEEKADRLMYDEKTKKRYKN